MVSSQQSDDCEEDESNISAGDRSGEAESSDACMHRDGHDEQGLCTCSSLV